MRSVISALTAIVLALTLAPGCRKKGARPVEQVSPAPAGAGQELGAPQATPPPASAPGKEPEPQKDDPDVGKPPPGAENRVREKWEEPVADPKAGDAWVLSPKKVAEWMAKGMPEAKLREKVIHALERDLIKAPMKASEEEQKALLKAGASKELVQFLMNLPVD